MIPIRQKCILFFVLISGVYFFINIPIVKNCIFLADDLSVIFFSNLNPFPIDTYWEDGLQNLIPTLQIEKVHYRPLTSLLTHLTYLAFGLKPLYWAVVSQGIHLINFVVLIYVFLEIQKIFNIKKVWLCFIVPIFYLFYPGNATNLAWLAARTDLIVILFCVSSFYFSLKYIQSRNFLFLIISSLLFLLGTITKENVVSWFVVEFMLVWQIYFLCNKPPSIFSSLVKLLNAKVTVCILYIFCRSVLALISNKSVLEDINFSNIIPVYFKSLLFTILPVDSGTFIYSFADSTVEFLLMYGVYFLVIVSVVIMVFPRKDFFKFNFIAFIITLSTLSFYIIAGGGTYRLFALTFVSLLIFVFNFLCVKQNISLGYPLKISSVIILVFFIYGSSKISNYWITNYKLQSESLESLFPIYDKDKENVVLNYPHALSQTYCYSDIGIYLYYKVNGTIGRFNNITGLAAITSHNDEHYIQGSTIEKINNTFTLSSEFNDTYFSSEPFFTGKSFTGEIYFNHKNYSIEVLKLNSYSKPVSFKLEYTGTFNQPVNYIIFTNGKFEKY